MGHALLAYTGNAGIGATNFDLTALTDPDFTQRNGHYTFTEPYQLMATAIIGANLTRGRFQVPHWNAIGEYNIYPVNRSTIVVQSNPNMDFYYDAPPPIPLNEEFQIQTSNNNAGTEQDFGLIWIATSDWSQNLPRGVQLINVRATVAVTGILNAWSGPAGITLSQSLRGGVYAVVGAVCQITVGIAFRIVFPRYRLYNGRKLRPGNLCMQNIGDTPQDIPWDQQYWLGEWGRFHTFELPQVEFLANVAGAQTLELRMWCIYLGEDLSLLNQGLGGGGVTI
jgi:hypothetical protein